MKKILYFLLVLGHYSFAQNVGIGTNHPTEKLEVNGGIKIGNTNNTVGGTVRWNPNKNDFEGYNGTSWVSLTGGKSGWGSQATYSHENVASELILNPNETGSVRGKALGVSLSTHGDYMLTGANYDYSPNPSYLKSAGTVRMFRKTANGWSYYHSLGPQFPVANERFGTSVTIRNKYIAVGAPGNNSSRGRVYLYELDANGAPVAMPSLSPGDGLAGDEFGYSVALSGDIVVAGGYKRKIGANVEQGRASIYIRNGNTWQYSQHITAPDGTANDWFGQVVSVDGHLVAISSQLNNNDHRGKVYLFRYNNGMWNYETTIEGHKQHEEFGSSLFLKGDTLVVGAPARMSSADSGKVYVYVRSGNSWQQQSVIMQENSTGNNLFGYSVYLYNGYLCVGARTEYVGSIPYAGKAYIFRFSDGSWHQQAVLAASVTEADMVFGTQVAMNGNTVFVTAPQATYAGNNEHGRLYFFYHQ